MVEIHPVYLTYLTPSAAQITTVFGGAIHVRLLEQPGHLSDDPDERGVFVSRDVSSGGTRKQ